MGVSDKEAKLTAGQQRVLKLLFKFRYVSAGLLSQVMGIRRVSAYEVLEILVNKDLVTKVYNNKLRAQAKPAYYFLNKSGVTTVRKLLEVKEPVVHALYKNAVATKEFVEHSLRAIEAYIAIESLLPDDAYIFTKTEINRFSRFPKNRPDLYIRTADDQEAIVVLAGEQPPYIIRKRLDEIISHSENEGWDGDYPRVCFILKDTHAKNSFLYTTHKKLESMGFDDEELYVLAASLSELCGGSESIWSNAMNPKLSIKIFE